MRTMFERSLSGSRCLVAVVGLVAGFAASGATASASAGAQPDADSPLKLVLQITVDGLRHDLVERDWDQFGEGGFRRLFGKGVVYDNAHYLHANTETIVGHTTLATGTTPARHGMIGNVWYYADSGEIGYNIEDPSAPILATRTVQTSGAQVDPAQLRAGSSGRSPTGILVPTLSDALFEATDGRSKNFGVSGKDRSAVAMAGKTGTAYWFSTDSGDFQTSRYYMDAYPDWVQDWNAQREAESFTDTQWHLKDPAASYRFIEQDDRPFEVDLKGYGRTFPHPYGSADHPLFNTRLLVSPAGDRLLLDFARTLIVEERLGQDDVVDYLSVSFSGVDAVNHFFGPSSLENEDQMRRLDRTLAELLEHVDSTVGLTNVVVVLSADHGMPDMPEHSAALGRDAGRMYSDELLDHARVISTELFGTDSLIRDFFRPYLYLDASAISAADLDGVKVAEAIADQLEVIPGIGGALTREDMSAGREAEAVRSGYHPDRAGDIYVYQSPYWFLFDRGAIGMMHGSPWDYDTHVPIVFMAPGVGHRRVDRLVHPIDVAPTLARLIGIPDLADAQGSPLQEMVSSAARD